MPAAQDAGTADDPVKTVLARAKAAIAAGDRAGALALLHVLLTEGAELSNRELLDELSLPLDALEARLQFGVDRFTGADRAEQHVALVEVEVQLDQVDAGLDLVDNATHGPRER